MLGPNQVCKGPDLSSSLGRGHAPLGVRQGGGVGGGELSDLSAARAQMECQHLQTAGDPGCFKREKGWATQAVGSPAVPESSLFLPQPSCSWEGGSVGGWLSLSLGGLNPALPVPGHEEGGLGGHRQQAPWSSGVLVHSCRSHKSRLWPLHPLLELRWAKHWQPWEGLPRLIQRH